MSMSMTVVLPAPLGPSRATVEPRWSERSRPRTARTAPNDFVKSCATNLSCSPATCEVLLMVFSGMNRCDEPKVLEETSTSNDEEATPSHSVRLTRSRGMLSSC
jgi:hypothetical protein